MYIVPKHYFRSALRWHSDTAKFSIAKVPEFSPSLIKLYIKVDVRTARAESRFLEFLPSVQRHRWQLGAYNEDRNEAEIFVREILCSLNTFWKRTTNQWMFVKLVCMDISQVTIHEMIHGAVSIDRPDEEDVVDKMAERMVFGN